VMFPQVNAATERVLAADGCRVSVPGGQGCCGALSLHAGRKQEALAFARALIGRLDDAGADGPIVTNAAGCGSTLKQYGLLFADDPQWCEPAARFAARVQDVTELLAERGPVAQRHPVDAVVAYHDACHLAHAQKVRSQPRSVLGQIPGLTVREIADGDLCCGSAGIYNIVNPGPAAELGERKADTVLATGADLLVAGNPGCLLQIQNALEQRGAGLRAAHTVELLDLSIRGGRLEDFR
jgi:glycolate oxidase iron-sulfur subunit